MSGKTVAKEVLDWLLHIAIAVVIGFLIVTFVAQRTVVNKHSMEPTMQHGDNLIVEKISPRTGNLKRGDVVTIVNASEELKEEGKTIIKRIIATENETIELKDGKVFINGNELKEDYIMGDYTGEVDPKYSKVTVPEGHVYVLGDNRGNSKDSRSIGPVSVDKIQGKAVFRVYPFNKMGVVK
ncbi:MAG: signal peptidase I [Acetivibrionales bacterium]|jgi:signal peptidase I